MKHRVVGQQERRLQLDLVGCAAVGQADGAETYLFPARMIGRLGVRLPVSHNCSPQAGAGVRLMHGRDRLRLVGRGWNCDHRALRVAEAVVAHGTVDKPADADMLLRADHEQRRCD